MMFLNEEFYDSLSADYDSMVSFDKNLSKRIEALKKYSMPNEAAADIGCGSGIDSISLAALGMNVTAFDPSKKMISQAEENASNNSVNINFVASSAEKISDKYYGKYSLAVSLGNTFANIPPENLMQAANKIFQLLNEKGNAVIQILNFEKILAEHERILNITKSKEKYYVRFYDFLDEVIHFNILSFSANDPAKRKFITTKLFPYQFSQLELAFKQAGFTKIEIYSDLNKNSFKPMESSNLVFELAK